MLHEPSLVCVIITSVCTKLECVSSDDTTAGESSSGEAWTGAGEQLKEQKELLKKLEAQVKDFIPKVKARMQAAAELSVPLTVEAESGVNWDEAH